MKGWTFYIVYGESGGFRYEWTKFCKRICFWKVAIAVVPLDLEVALDRAGELIRARKSTLSSQE
jgi:hypothetical protein